jgi:hypothetical protein
MSKSSSTSPEHDAHAGTVGPVLRAGPASAPVLAALRELNPEASITDDGAYLRVRVPGRCRLTRSAIERHAHAPFRFPGDLEAVMPAFSGRLNIGDEEATWSMTLPPIVPFTPAEQHPTGDDVPVGGGAGRHHGHGRGS